VRLHNPAGLGGSTVALSFNGGTDNYPCTLAQNANYPAETNAGIWQAQVSVVTAAPAGCQVNPGGGNWPKVEVLNESTMIRTSGASMYSPTSPKKR